MAASLTAFFVGRGVTWVGRWLTLRPWALNIVLDYAWIFGHFGLPALGIEARAGPPSLRSVCRRLHL